MSGKQIKRQSFIDFALRILFEPDDDERARLDDEWKIALQETDRAVAVRLFAQREGFFFTIGECQDALAFWDKFMERNPACAGATGPVLY